MAEEEGEEGDAIAQEEEVKETPVALPVTFNLQKPGTLLMMLQVTALSMAHWNQALLLPFPLRRRRLLGCSSHAEELSTYGMMHTD
jgi:hypothetical protein